MPLTKTLPRAVGDFACLPQSDWIDARDAVAASERATIPDGAKFVLFSASDVFYAKMGDGTVTAAVPSGDVTDGTASMCNPTFRSIAVGQTHIAVAAPIACDITLEYFAAIPTS